MLRNSACGFGQVALSALLAGRATAAPDPAIGVATDRPPHFRPRAKRIIFLFMWGGPSHVDIFDPKPRLNIDDGKPISPESVGSDKKRLGNALASPFRFAQHGDGGVWISELFPNLARHADRLCVVRSLHTEGSAHGEALLRLHTGQANSVRPSIGAWLSYGLGQETVELPSFVVLITKDKGGQPLGAHLWGSGFLPTRHQGVLFRAAKDPVLYLGNPPGIDDHSRRQLLDRLRELHQHQLGQIADSEIQNRIEHYEMAYSMQRSVPEATDFGKESAETLASYGPDVNKPGTFAANCLLARRLAERGVRFIQLYHQDWDHHGGLPNALPKLCKETDQPAAALVKDLKRCGLLDDTLVVWGGEFGRTNYCQGKIQSNFGRDHHPRCYSMWLAGGGIKAGSVYGQTCEFGYNITLDGLHIHDLHATMLHLLGIDHERLTYKFQGRRYRLTDVHGQVVQGLLA